MRVYTYEAAVRDCECIKLYLSCHALVPVLIVGLNPVVGIWVRVDNQVDAIVDSVVEVRVTCTAGSDKQ